MFRKSIFLVILTVFLLIAITTPAQSQHNPGDANGDATVDLFDAIFLINLLCHDGPSPDPLSNGDANGDCVIDMDDTRLILYSVFTPYYCVQFADTACTIVSIGDCEDQNQNLHDSSFCDPVFPVCPLGDAAFRVHLRNGAGEPVDGHQAVWVTLYDCNDVYNCDSDPQPTIVCARGIADADGILSFYLDGGNCDNLCFAVVSLISVVSGSPIEFILDTVPVKMFDTDGDLVVSYVNDYTETECNDYNGDEVINTSDAAIFTQHLGHSCGEYDPCFMFNHTFRLIPESNLELGQVITLELALANNSPDTCYVENIDFYQAPFSTGDNYTLFHTEPYGEFLHPGKKDTISIEYTIPDDGQGCLKTIFTTDCCLDPIESMPRCFNSIQHCSIDSNVCYTFHIELDNFPVENIILNTDQLKPGWSLVETHVPSTFPITSSDYIEYQICTPDNINLGDSAKMQVYVCYDTQCSDVDIFETRVVITSRSGDTNGDCSINVSDAVYIINYVFITGSPEPLPYLAGEVNCDGSVNVSDAVYIINYVFVSGPPPCVPE